MTPKTSPGMVRRLSRRTTLGESGPLERQRRRIYWPFVLPALSIYVLLVIAPTVVTFYAAFTKWRGSGDEMKWIGLDNYTRLFADPVFLGSFRNTMAITFIGGAVVFALAFAAVVLLREMRAKKSLRAILFIPYFVSPIAIGIALGIMLAPEGAVNAALRIMGLDSLALNWLSPENAFRSILVGIVWVSTGYFVLLIMSGVDQIPRYYYEDAELAGVNQWQKFRHVTLPLSWDVVTVTAVLWIIDSIRIFEFVFAFSGLGSAPPIHSRTIAITQFLTTTGGRFPAYDMGYGAAMGIFMLVVTAVLIVVVRRLMKRDAVQWT